MPPLKRETVVVLSLSLMFFLLASWGLGHDEIPSTGWTVSESARVIVDLGSQVEVSEIVFMVKTGELNLEISTGEPDSWEKVVEASVEGYNRWRRVGVDRLTRFLMIDFDRSHGEILEMTVAGEDGHAGVGDGVAVLERVSERALGMAQVGAKNVETVLPDGLFGGKTRDLARGLVEGSDAAFTVGRENALGDAVQYQ